MKDVSGIRWNKCSEGKNTANDDITGKTKSGVFQKNEWTIPAPVVHQTFLTFESVLVSAWGPSIPDRFAYRLLEPDINLESNCVSKKIKFQQEVTIVLPTCSF